VLNSLEAQLNISNENIKAAAAGVEESRALVRQAQAGFWPQIDLSGSRIRTVRGKGTGNTTTSPTKNHPHSTTTVSSAGISGSWDIDLWGRIRRSTQSSRANFQVSEAQLASARLAAQAELATDYFELRAQDQLQVILNDIVAAEQQSLKITE